MRVECTSHGLLLESDDGFEVERTRMEHEQKHRYRRGVPLSTTITGVHPSHVGTHHCEECGRPLDNGCYGSHFPCGFDFDGQSLVGVLADHFAATPGENREEQNHD